MRRAKMAKAVKYSAIAREIKKEYLKEHLENVKRAIEIWIPEINTPAPLTSHKDVWGWQSIYTPPMEQDPDSNHMLKRHLRSRALWSHHANWERKIGKVWYLTNRVRKEADDKHIEHSNNKQRQYTAEYVTVALWKAFDVARGREIDDWYKVPDDQHGVSYGAYKLELSAVTSEECSSIEKEHREFNHYLAELEDMCQLIELWHEVNELKTYMQTIGNNILKSGDILYPCKFCRHLWK